ncbi:hypothetical protein QE152_g10143 [Popillia japonica]|uniref:Uncharacterized protein n=1 Tax=Popillia japonica TaxID=7064 RepID=A0AAW1LV89_POPJA
MNVSKAIDEIAKALDCGKGIVYSIRKEKENHLPISVQKTKQSKNTRLQIHNEHVQILGRCKVHSFFLRNIPPTLEMILSATSHDVAILNFSRSIFYGLFKDIALHLKKLERR